jgi:hypothetical protein
METITSAQKHLAGRGNGKERYLVWNTSLKTAISTPGIPAYEGGAQACRSHAAMHLGTVHHTAAAAATPEKLILV